MIKINTNKSMIKFKTITKNQILNKAHQLYDNKDGDKYDQQPTHCLTNVNNNNNNNVSNNSTNADNESIDDTTFTAHRRRTIGFQESDILNAMIFKRKKQQILLNDIDVTPKNLGNIDLRLIVDLNIDLKNCIVPRELLVKEQSTNNFNDANYQKNNPHQTNLSKEFLSFSNISANMKEINSKFIKNEIENVNEKLSIKQNLQKMAEEPSTSSSNMELNKKINAVKSSKSLPAFIKIMLPETNDIVLYEKVNITVLTDSDEAKRIQADNNYYENLSKNRRTSDAETQTIDILYKSRLVNTYRIRTCEMGTFVSNYDMYDTYADLVHIIKSTESYDRKSQIQIKKNGENIIDKIVGGGDAANVIGNTDQHYRNRDDKINLNLASMVIERLLAGNVYHMKQRRFRNMILPNPLNENVKYLYRLDILWKYQIIETMGKSVASFSWCPGHTDLLAIGYGIYSFVPHKEQQSGYVCVWSIKNPVNPERRYKYSVPVTTVSFSKHTPQLLAIGLYNGTIEIRDITDINGIPIAKSNRFISSQLGYEPIWQIEWIISIGYATGISSQHVGRIEELLITSQNGLILKCSLTNGPYLLGFRQMKLDRVAGDIDGLKIHKPKKNLIIEKQLNAERHCQALTLQVHPTKSDIYFVGTNEGCLHRCSTFYPHQHTSVQRVHIGNVFSMEFSPWSPKIFLTCGTDWCIRIWIENCSEPIIELCNGMEAIHCAQWSPIHSTIICCATRHHIELWDIRRSCLKPLSKTTLNTGNSLLTVCRFTKCGRSILIGDADGTTYVCALEDMPFPPHFQYDELQSAIYRTLNAKPDLLQQIKSFGYLGYP